MASPEVKESRKPDKTNYFRITHASLKSISNKEDGTITSTYKIYVVFEQ